MKKKLTIVSLLLTIVMILGAACGQNQANNAETEMEPVESTEPIETTEEETKTVGALILKVNPEIKINYDADGNVTTLEAKNKDAQLILDEIKDYEGKEVKVIAKDLITVIGQQGFFVEEVEGEARQIILDIEEGSVMPNTSFVENIIKSIEDYITSGDLEKDIFEVSNDDVVKSLRPNLKVNIDGYQNLTDDSPYDESNYGTTITVPVTQPQAGDDSPYDDSPYDDSPYESSSPYDDSPYDDSPYEAPSPYDDSPYEASSPYDDSPYDDSGYDDSDYD